MQSQPPPIPVAESQPDSADAEAGAVARPAIALRGVHKFFSRTEQRVDTFKESLLSTLSQRSRHELVHALDGIDLEIGRGEAVGLVGPNGSGKSTMLKLMARISEPTRGRIEINGRVLGLIELGAGFHPELSGEENIRLQGAIYGLASEQIEQRMEAILEFAEMGDFRAMPVKHYSSGMFVRLGFAIAVHADPEILLVDEVLTVGDLPFQERCLCEIQQLRRRGLTLIFVTHYPEQAERLCDRIVWLEQGTMRRIGPACDVLADYHQDLIEHRHRESRGPLDERAIAVGLPGRFGTGQARIESMRILDERGRPRTHFRRGQAMAIEIDYTAEPEVEAVDCMVPLQCEATILTLWRLEREAIPSRPVDGKGRIRLEIPRLPLLPGRYVLTVSLTPPGRPYEHYDVLYKLFNFLIEPDPDWNPVSPIEMKALSSGNDSVVTSR